MCSPWSLDENRKGASFIEMKSFEPWVFRSMGALLWWVLQQELW